MRCITRRLCSLSSWLSGHCAWAATSLYFRLFAFVELQRILSYNIFFHAQIRRSSLVTCGTLPLRRRFICCTHGDVIAIFSSLYATCAWYYSSVRSNPTLSRQTSSSIPIGPCSATSYSVPIVCFNFTDCSMVFVTCLSRITLSTLIPSLKEMG